MEDSTAQSIESLLRSLTDLVEDYVQHPPKDARGVEQGFTCAMERVKQKLLRTRLKRNDDCWYAVRLVQQGVMDMITCVTAGISASEILAAKQGLNIFSRSVNSRLYFGLEALLAYLEHTYKNEFDYDIPLSQGQWSVWTLKSHNALAIVWKWCDEKRISEKLRDMVFEPFHEVIAPAEGMPLITYREWKYLAALLNDVTDLPTNADTIDEEALLRVLVLHNFNHDAYIRYCMSYLDAAVAQPDSTLAEQMEKVYYYRHLITTVYPLRNVALRPDNDALHERLMNWVDKALVRCQQLLAIPSSAKERPGERTKTFWSIPNLGGWNSLLYDCKFYDDENYSRICRVIAAGYSTMGSEEPSFGNVYDPFTKPSDAAYRFAYDMCHKILRRLEELGIRGLSKSRKGG